MPAQDRPDQALGLLEHLHALAIARAGMGNLIDIQALRALALAAGGDHTAAVAALAEALTLANHRVFADEGALMTVQLGRLLATQRTEQTAARALRSTTWQGSYQRSAPHTPSRTRRNVAPPRCPS